MSEPVIRLQHVTRHPGTATHPIVHDLTLALHGGEILVLLGPSGSGKTTTLRLIAGLELPDEGEIYIRGVCVTNRNRPLPPETRRVGMVFQDYALFPHMTVADNVRFALHAYPKHEQRERMHAVLHRVGLTGFADRFPHQLSGGQQQRVAIARALAPEPSVILFDEPFSNLDAAIRDHVRGELRDILRATSTSAIIVTHDQSEALAIADRIALLNDGRLHQIDTPETLFVAPRTAFAARFMGQANFINVTPHTDGLWSELGMLTLTPVANGAPALDHSHTILARYDDIGFGVGEGHTNAQISSRHYEGTVYHYQLTLTSGQMLSCKLPHDQKYAVGTAVRAYFTATHALVYFVGDAAHGYAVPHPRTHQA